MELKKYASLFWIWSWLIILFMAIAGGLAYFQDRQTVFIYEASTTVNISQAPSMLAAPNSGAIAASGQLITNYVELIRKRPVMLEVIKSLGLSIDPGTLSSMISVTGIRGTTLMVLSVRDTNPQEASQIANEVIRVFSRQNQEMQTSRYAGAKKSLEAELGRAQQDVDHTQASIDALLFASTSEKLGNRNPVSVTLQMQGNSPELTLSPEDKSEYNRLQTLVAQYRSNYSSLLKSYEDIRFAESNAFDVITVVEEALPPGAPINARSIRNIFFPMIVGALLAAGIILVIDYLDDTIKSSEEVEALAECTTLGVIARITATTATETLIAARDPRSPITEAYRVLRANIDFSAVDQPIRALLISSSSPGEGKSTTIANLAVTIAQTGKEVILVDTDLRRPTLHKTFSRKNNLGLTTALMHPENNPQDYLIETDIPHLRLMTSGPLPPNPAELVGSQRMADLIQSLQSQAGIVLFDSPPLMSVVDASLLARICDATLLVVQAGSTRTGPLQRAREQLLQSGARLLGVVMNQVATSPGNYYYYYYYNKYYYSASGGDSRHRRRSALQHLPLLGALLNDHRSRRNGHVPLQAPQQDLSDPAADLSPSNGANHDRG